MSMRVAAFEDDAEAVPDDALLYRRVVWSKIGGREHCPAGHVGKLNSNCFTDWPADKALEEGLPGPCMSVGISSELERLGFTAEKMLENYPECGLACVSAGDLRKLARADANGCGALARRGVRCCGRSERRRSEESGGVRCDVDDSTD
jgi:hypothetical protein